MFSTMIVELSTMIPKSTAPIDSKLADLSCTYSTVTENSKASGIMMATMPALARSPRKMNRIAITRPIPISRLCLTLCVVTWTSSVRWLNSLIFIPGGRSFRFWISSIFSSTAFRYFQRLFVLPHQHDALHDVVFRFPASIPADDAEPRLIPFHDLGDVTDQNGSSLVLRDDDVADFLELLVDDLLSLGCVLRVERVNALSRAIRCRARCGTEGPG